MNYSVVIGFILNKELKKRIRFWQDKQIPSDIVNVTCESCPIFDCEQRKAEPWRIKMEQKNIQIRTTIETLRK
jgi:hypothetical protein